MIQQTPSMLKQKTVCCSTNQRRRHTTLKDALQPYRLVYTAAFDKVVEVNQEATLTYHMECVHLVLTYPQYNTRREANLENTDNDRLDPEEIKQVSDVFDAVLVCGGYVVIFCYMFSFQTVTRSCRALLKMRRWQMTMIRKSPR